MHTSPLSRRTFFQRKHVCKALSTWLQPSWTWNKRSTTMKGSTKGKRGRWSLAEEVLGRHFVSCSATLLTLTPPFPTNSCPLPQQSCASKIHAWLWAQLGYAGNNKGLTQQSSHYSVSVFQEGQSGFEKAVVSSLIIWSWPWFWYLSAAKAAVICFLRLHLHFAGLLLVRAMIFWVHNFGARFSRSTNNFIGVGQATHKLKAKTNSRQAFTTEVCI